jgi:hypothetical protein
MAGDELEIREIFVVDSFSRTLNYFVYPCK